MEDNDLLLSENILEQYKPVVDCLHPRPELSDFPQLLYLNVEELGLISASNDFFRDKPFGMYYHNGFSNVWWKIIYMSDGKRFNPVFLEEERGMGSIREPNGLVRLVIFPEKDSTPKFSGPEEYYPEF